jgi:hypothetical protein
MEQNKTGKYIKYAIGEIVLVVIGILIALGINNWNEDRKARKLEKYLLENLAKNLEQNCESLQNRITFISAKRKYGKIILTALENKSYHDSLETIFPRVLVNASTLQLSQVGYEAIKNTGFEIIHDDTLRTEIISFFEESRLTFDNQLKKVDIDAAYIEKYIDENFVQGLSRGGGYKPFNPEKLMKENYFYALISKKDNQSLFIGVIMGNHLKKSKTLLQNIKTELNNF